MALIEPQVAARRAPRLERKVSTDQPLHDLRETTNVTLYVIARDDTWKYLPHGFPPFKTVYGYFAAWRDDGTTEHIHDVLRRRVAALRSRARWRSTLRPSKPPRKRRLGPSGVTGTRKVGGYTGQPIRTRRFS